MAGQPSPRPASVVAVDWDPYAQEAYVLTVTPNGPGFGEVWRTDLATYTIRTPITPSQPPSCNPTQPLHFTDLAVYRYQNQTLVAIAMKTFFGFGVTGNVDVFDSVTGASVISAQSGPYCRTNVSYRRIDAGYMQNAVVYGMRPDGDGRRDHRGAAARAGADVREAHRRGRHPLEGLIAGLRPQSGASPDTAWDPHEDGICGLMDTLRGRSVSLPSPVEHCHNGEAVNVHMLEVGGTERRSSPK